MWFDIYDNHSGGRLGNLAGRLDQPGAPSI
jgi:hypothetical protein